MIRTGDIIPGLKQGDSRAFSYLFDQYYTAICYFAEGLLHDKEEAKDIAAESFRKFWQKKDDFETTGSIRAFLYITTRNACIDFLRKKKKGMLYSTANEYPDIADNAYAEELETESELLRKIYAEVQRLPGKCREVFLLTYFDGLDARQIAERLNISVSNVTSQRARAIQLLKNVLSGKDLLLLLAFISGFSCKN